MENLVGFFVNTLVLRTDTGGDPTFRELLGRVRERDLAAYAHQDVPFERLVEAVNPDRATSHHPLFQVMLTFDTSRQDALGELGRLPGISTSLLPVHTGLSRFDLVFAFDERRDAEGGHAGLDLAVEFSTELFDTATVRTLTERLLRLLTEVAADPGARLGDVDVLLPGEHHDLLVAANRPDGAPVSPTPVTATLPELFERQAARHPGRTALTFEGTSLSYADLNARANRLARLLTARGIGPDALVALALPRSAELVVALLAVVKSGAAYVPLDPGYPADRLAHALSDSAPAALLTDRATADRLPAHEVPLVVLGDDPAHPDGDATRAYPATDLAQSERIRPSTRGTPPTSSTPPARPAAPRVWPCRTATSCGSSPPPSSGSASTSTTCGRCSTRTPSTSRCGSCGVRCCTAAGSSSSRTTSAGTPPPSCPCSPASGSPSSTRRRPRSTNWPPRTGRAATNSPCTRWCSAVRPWTCPGWPTGTNGTPRTRRPWSTCTASPRPPCTSRTSPWTGPRPRPRRRARSASTSPTCASTSSTTGCAPPRPASPARCTWPARDWPAATWAARRSPRTASPPTRTPPCSASTAPACTAPATWPGAAPMAAWTTWAAPTSR